MELTRRDAIAAAAAVVGGERLFTSDGGPEPVVSTLHAMTEVVGPTSVDVDREFVRTHVLERSHIQPRYYRRASAATSELDARARLEYQRAFTDLSVADRKAVLRTLGVPVAHANPTGTVTQRIRYYLVDEVLYVLYSHPLGGRAVGVENPPGYPGGREAYQRGP